MEASLALDDTIYEEIPEWDDPIWYKPNGELHKLNHLWYSNATIKETVLAWLSSEEVSERARGTRKAADSPAVRRWCEITTAPDGYKSALFVDRFFVQLGLPPFHSVMGDPELVSLYAPRDDAQPQRWKLNGEQRFEIRRRKLAGESVKALAEEYGVSARTIRRA